MRPLLASVAVSIGLAPSLLLGEASYETIRSDLSHQLLSIDQPALPYRYKISLDPTTIQDWVTFLNCKAKYDDPHNLYKGGDTERTLTDGVYGYSVASGLSGTNPVRQVTMYDCQRYVNWLENGANETADTETGTYPLAVINSTLGELAPRTQGSRYFLPTGDEWFTALSTIHSPVGYFEWSDSPSIYENGAVFMYRYSTYAGGSIGPAFFADGPGRAAGMNGEAITFRIASVSAYGPDTEAPVITLFGDDPIQIYRGSSFADPGAMVTDNVDSTRTIAGTGAVNTSMVGIYTLTYTAQDAAGNPAVPVTRTVNVVLDPAGDEDGDGLTNGQELTLGTSPYQKDTDGDGANDPVELTDGTSPTDPASFNSLGQGLVAYYPLNGNSLDVSGNGLHGIGAATYVPDAHGTGNGVLSCDPLPSGIETGSMGLQPSWSFVFWYKITDPSVWPTGDIFKMQKLVGGVPPTDDNYVTLSFRHPYISGTAPNLCLKVGHTQILGFGSGFGTVVWPPPATPFIPGFAKPGWHQAVLIFENGEWKLYVDRTRLTSRSSILFGGVTATAPDALRAVLGGAGERFLLDDVRIYSRALSDSEIAINYLSLPDGQAPEITLLGSNPLQIMKGIPFTDPGATATDDIDPSVSVLVSGSVDTSLVGAYNLTYSAQDAAGNQASPVTRTVQVVLDPNQDEDNDGAPNGLEVSSGTDPYSPDSDADGLEDGYELGFGRYEVISGSFTWEQARLDAESRGGHLLTVVSSEEWQLVQDRLGASMPSENYWMGGSDQITEGVWVWVTGEKWSYNQWATSYSGVGVIGMPGAGVIGMPDEPNGGSGANFLGGKLTPFGGFLLPWQTQGKGWGDFGNETFVSYILEKGFFSKAMDDDSDDDSFSDGVEIAAGSDPNDIQSVPTQPLVPPFGDPDGDGVFSAYEVAYGTNPFLADTDGDGLNDGYELGYGRYELVTGSFTWDQARSHAETHRNGEGHLLTVSHAQEWQLVQDRLGSTMPSEGYWLGGTDVLEEGNWKWITGEKWSLLFNNWKGGTAPIVTIIGIGQQNEPNGALSENYLAGVSGFGGILIGGGYSPRQWGDLGGVTLPSYIWEKGAYSNATDDDTDDDTFKDGAEILAGSDPNDPDSLPGQISPPLEPMPFYGDLDEDGVVNGLELAYGTNPENADTDGDGLTDGYELGFGRYEVVSGSFTWDQAFAHAAAYQNGQGHLLTVSHAQEWQLVRDRLGSALPNGGYWLGGTDLPEEGNWKWVTGEKWNYPNWTGGEPGGGRSDNYLAGSTPLGGMISIGDSPPVPAWGDLGGVTLTYYLWEKGAYSNATDDDTDDDTFKDGAEILAGSDPNDPDSFPGQIPGSLTLLPYDGDEDGDGVINGLEVKYGTNPENPDTDGDQLSDYVELGFGRYEVVSNFGGLNWDQARLDAEARGGHLLTVSHAQEWQMVLDRLGSSMPADDYWIGGTDSFAEGTWMWVTGEQWSPTYANWVPPQGILIGPGPWGEPDGGVLDNYLGGKSYQPNILIIGGGSVPPVKAWGDFGQVSFPQYILEKGAYSDATDRDTDDDNYNDKQEIDAGSDPNDPLSMPNSPLLALFGDADGDGLTNGQEGTLGTNPNLKDSDGDGVNDPVEVADGTDPLVPTSCNSSSQGLLAWYRFENNTLDSSGNHHHAINSHIQIVSSRFAGNSSKAVSFNGLNSQTYVYAQNVFTNPAIQSQFTFSLWVKPGPLTTSSGGYRVLFEGTENVIDGVNTPANPYFVLHNDNSIRFASYQGVEAQTTADQVIRNEWNHLVLRGISNPNRIRIDIFNRSGHSTFEKTYFGAPLWGSQALADFILGADRHALINRPDMAEANLLGEMDDVRVYDRMLSDSEVTQLNTIEAPPASIADWLGSMSSSTEMIEKYVFGGATGPAAPSEPISTTKVGTEVTLSVIVRTNDPKVSVLGEVATELAGFSSPTTRQTISGIPAANQEGVPAGCQRQEFKMNADGLQRGFLRVRANIAN